LPSDLALLPDLDTEYFTAPVRVKVSFS